MGQVLVCELDDAVIERVKFPITDVVVDVSVAVKWFVPENYSIEATRFLDPRFRRHIPVLQGFPYLR